MRQVVNKQRTRPITSLSELTAKYGITRHPGRRRLFGLPQFTLSGRIAYQGLGETGSMPNFKIHQVHQYLDNVSWNRGNHNFKFGADLRWNRSDIFGGDSSHGNFTFDGQFHRRQPGRLSARADRAGFALTTQLAGQMRFRNYMLYAQDDWKVTPRLTPEPGPALRTHLALVGEAQQHEQIDLAPGAELQHHHCRRATAAVPGPAAALVIPDTNNWAPRVGLA